jgi:hypothetical protein
MQRTTLSTSLLILSCNLHQQGYNSATEKLVGKEFVVARKRVEISKLAMSSAEEPHLRQVERRDRIKVLASRSCEEA